MKQQYTVKEFGAQNQKVVFFFAGMGTRTWLYTNPIQELVKHGFYVIAYDFDPLVVRKGDVDSLLSLSERVGNSVSKYVEHLKTQDITEYAAFGSSMGTLQAIRSAAEIPDITKLIVNMTYGSVAENIWTWWFMKPAKKKAIKQGYTMESLDKKLCPVSPIPNAKKLKGKKVLLYLSSKDKILLFKQSIQFKQALDNNYINYVYIQNDKHGHIATGYTNLKNSNNYLKFLGSK